MWVISEVVTPNVSLPQSLGIISRGKLELSNGTTSVPIEKASGHQ